jgi:DNA-binding NtrC family response regulator
MRILVVDDEPAIRFSLAELLADEGHEVREAAHAPAALGELEAAPADLVICDLRMPAMDGLQLLEEVAARHPETPVVLMTAHGDERTAVKALHLGAYDYLPKPFDNEEVRALVRRVREMLALRAENARLREELAQRHGQLIGGSASMQRLYQTIRRAGPTDASVLITGESGTGKELVARALHEEGPRRRHPFVTVNCGALPGELVESELFGHAKGAFTGADREREGRFEAAGRGTIFLDEIGDLPLPAQAKVLRTLEERAVTRVGENRLRAVDARVVAATHRPLERMVGEGTFREDLLYRLRVIHLEVPPLRERREDILPIAIHLLQGLAERHGRRIERLTEATRRALLSHHWPGNVRELRNALERAVILSEGCELEVGALPSSVLPEAELRPAEAALAGLSYEEAQARARADFDRTFLAAALERHGGNLTRTAEALGMHRQSLQKLLRRAGVRREG